MTLGTINHGKCSRSTVGQTLVGSVVLYILNIVLVCIIELYVGQIFISTLCPMVISQLKYILVFQKYDQLIILGGILVLGHPTQSDMTLHTLPVNIGKTFFGRLLFIARHEVQGSLIYQII